MNRHHSARAAIALAAAFGSIALGASPASAADKDCSDFASQKAAQIFFLKAGGPSSDPHGLDAEGDGIACESNPAPYYYGTTVPDGDGSGDSQPAPAPQPVVVKSSVKLSVDRHRAIKGEPFTLVASVSPQGRRTVVVQRFVNRHWKFFAKGVTSREGKVSGSFRTPAESTKYRALVKPTSVGNKKFTSATGTAEALRVQHQRVTLAFADDTLDEGRSAHARVGATPVRVGRTLAIQIRQPGGWRTIRTVREDRDGSVALTLPSAGLGEYRYRAVARQFHGAAPSTSATRTLTVQDVTAPPAPAAVYTTPGDSTVGLTWSGTQAEDFSHYVVWVRQDGVGTWTLATTTAGTAAAVGSLTNDVAYWFAVTSVDVHGNESAPSAEVSATPVAPPAPPAP